MPRVLRRRPRVSNSTRSIEILEPRRLMSAVGPAATGPDLTPFQPPGWSGPIVVSNVQGTTIGAATISTTDTIYIDFAVANIGDAAAGAFSVRLLVDDVLLGTFDSTGLTPQGAADTSFKVLDTPRAPLAAGVHTVTLQIDPAGAVAEGDETNNVLQRTFDVGQTVNSPPTIDALQISPDPVPQGTPIVLTAVNPVDPDGSLSAVRFYRETNGTLGLQTGAGGDQLLATDFSSPYSTTVSTAALPFNTYTYYAQAADVQGALSSSVSATSTVRPANLSAMPGSPNLQPESDTGTQTDDNLTRLNNSSEATVLSFLVPNTIPGATIRLFVGGVEIGSAQAADMSTVVSTTGNQRLADGVQEVFAVQTEPGKIPSGESAPLDIVIDTAGPRLAGLRVRGSGWSNAFLNYLNAQGLGQGGYLLPAGARQSDPLPWSGINQVGIQLADGEAGAIAGNALSVTGIRRGDYGATSSADVGLFNLASPLLADRITARVAAAGVTDAAGNPLDGEFSGGFPTGNGQSGGDFVFNFNVLPGDANQSSGAVNSADLVQVRNRVGRTAGAPGSGQNSYSPFADIDANGAINATDLVLVRNRVGSSLPTSLFAAERIRPARDGEASELIG